MPSRSRREKAKMLKQMDRAAENLPEHIRGRLGKPSPVADAIMASGPNPNDKFLIYTEAVEGQLIKQPERGPAGGTGKTAAADERCSEIRARNFKYWGLKHKAKHIALSEGISERTIKRYFDRMPK